MLRPEAEAHELRTDSFSHSPTLTAADSQAVGQRSSLPRSWSSLGSYDSSIKKQPSCLTLSSENTADTQAHSRAHTHQTAMGATGRSLGPSPRPRLRFGFGGQLCHFCLGNPLGWLHGARTPRALISLQLLPPTSTCLSPTVIFSVSLYYSSMYMHVAMWPQHTLEGRGQLLEMLGSLLPP